MNLADYIAINPSAHVEKAFGGCIRVYINGCNPSALYDLTDYIVATCTGNCYYLTVRL